MSYLINIINFWYKYSENSLGITIFAFKFMCSSVFKKEIEDYEYIIAFSQAYHASSRGSLWLHADIRDGNADGWRERISQQPCVDVDAHTGRHCADLCAGSSSRTEHIPRGKTILAKITNASSPLVAAVALAIIGVVLWRDKRTKCED